MNTVSKEAIKAKAAQIANTYKFTDAGTTHYEACVSMALWMKESFKEQDTSIERLRQWVIEQRNLAHVNCLEAEKQALNNVLVHIESLQNSQHHDN